MHAAGLLVEAVLYVLIALMFVRLIASLVQSFARSWQPSGIILIALEATFSITDMMIRPMRRVVPPLRLGSVAVDLAFILVFVVLSVLRALNETFLLSA